MTDLERVRDAASYIRRQEPRADVVNALGIIEDIIDTHLKEDAEREAAFENLDKSDSDWRDAYFQVRAELTRLREENEKWQAHQERTKVLKKKAEAQRDTLLAALRFLLKQVDEVERTSVIRKSDIYRNARAAISEVEGEK